VTILAESGFNFTQIQIHPDPFRSTQIHPDPPRPTQIHPDPSRSAQIHPDLSTGTQIHLDPPGVRTWVLVRAVFLFSSVAFSPFFKRFAMRGYPRRLLGTSQDSFGAGGCQVVPFAVIFGHLFEHILAPLASRWSPRALPGTALGQAFARWCHLWSFLVTFLDTFWHPWCQGGHPGRTHGAPRGTFGSTFVPPWCKNGAKGCRKFGFVDFMKIGVFSW